MFVVLLAGLALAGHAALEQPAYMPPPSARTTAAQEPQDAALRANTARAAEASPAAATLTPAAPPVRATAAARGGRRGHPTPLKSDDALGLPVASLETDDDLGGALVDWVLDSGRNKYGVQGAHLNPLGLFLDPLGLLLRTSIPFV
jgi:hypothetical protein